MAYLDLTQPLPRLLPAHDAPTLPAGANEGLTELDRMVIALSRNDPRSSLTTPGRFRRIFAYLFSMRLPNALADPRLEALRRFAVLLRKQRTRLPETETARLVAAGYSLAAVADARRIIEPEFA